VAGLGATVSVIIPVHNRRSFVADAVQSALEQSPPPLEIIVVDDGSTDGTANFVAQRFGAAVRLVQQENRERGAARNHGLSAAHGEYVAFLDSDDRWCSDHLQASVEAATKNDWLVVYSGLEYRDERFETRLRTTPARYSLSTEQLARGRSTTPSCVVARRDFLLSLGGFSEDRRMSGFEDWHLWMRASLTQPLRPVDRVTVQLRQHAGRSIVRSEVFNRSYACAVESLLSDSHWAPLLRAYRRQLGFYCRVGLAHSHCASAKYGPAGRLLMDALRLRPLGVLVPAWWSAAIKCLSHRSIAWRPAERYVRNHSL
jgi:glycosyltransferase involved in cell wall biosynthesis